ncbi:MAG TPA: zinc-dependent metalloprotease [Acidimicrobiales bacterium]|nr:zinc-dependent metalloprotease [Acidimicrobiales bacterium]
MSEPGSPNPFEGFPLFGDLAKLFSQGGRGVPWDAARSLALAVATDNQSEPNVDPIERIKLEQLARVAELHVANVTGLSTTVTGRELTVLPVNRGHWAQRTLEDYRPLLEKLAGSLGSPQVSGLGGAETGGGGELDLGDDLGLGADPDDQFAAMLGPMIQAMQPMMVAMTAGSMVGHLARGSFGQYDLPIPRTPSDELLILVPNLDAFGEEWSLPADDLRLWICLHEIAHHTVLGVPHVRERLEQLLTRYTTSFRTDPQALEEHLGDIDLSGGPESLAGLQQVLGEPGVLLGAIQSDEQRALLPQLDALVAVVVGVVDHVMDDVGAKLISSYGMLTEALRRRRVETAEADRFVERLLGLELAQATYDRGARFVAGVIERAGAEGLARLWESERMLPSPPEVDAPGLWLARIDLPDLPAE